jgi:ATP synthase protein I
MHLSDVALMRRVLGYQLVTTLLLAALALPFGSSVALSVLIGAGVCLTANAAFAFWVFREYRAQEPGGLVARFYGAEIAKLGVVFGLFAIAFATIGGLNLPALLISYFAAQILPTVLASTRGAGSTRER